MYHAAKFFLKQKTKSRTKCKAAKLNYLKNSGVRFSLSHRLSSRFIIRMNHKQEKFLKRHNQSTHYLSGSSSKT